MYQIEEPIKLLKCTFVSFGGLVVVVGFFFVNKLAFAGHAKRKQCEVWP